MSDGASFKAWARAVVDETAARLISEIDGAHAGPPKSLKAADYEAAFVHFSDAHLPQALCVWIFATRAGGSKNFPHGGDIIGVGLKQDADEELDKGAWRFRLQGSRFRWREHNNARYEGFRLIEPADALREAPVEDTAMQLAASIAQQLKRARAIPDR